MARRFAQSARDTDGILRIIRKCTKCDKLAIELIESDVKGATIKIEKFKTLSGEVTIIKQIRKYQVWCRTCNNKYRRDRYQNDPDWREKSKSISKNWKKDRYQNDPEWRERTKQDNRDYTLRIKIKAMEKLGGVFCVGLDGLRCRFNSGPNSYVIDVDVLQVDHIHDDGAEDREKGLIGPTLYRHIVNDLSVEEARSKYQVLCGSCNPKKESERRRRKTGETRKTYNIPSQNGLYMAFRIDPIEDHET